MLGRDSVMPAITRNTQGIGRSENSIRLKKNTFYSPIEARATLAPTSKLPVERKFVIDSRVSMNMLSKKDLSSANWKL